MSKPKLLDLFCGAGGVAMGYHRAGFDVLGVDLNPQPRYPFEFIQADALEFLASHPGKWDAIHASPPCQAYTQLRSLHDNQHPMLVVPVRWALQSQGVPYVIENVPGAPLTGPILLCGSMFALEVRRHRLFESNVELSQPDCNHAAQQRVYTVTGHPGGTSTRDGSSGRGSTADWRRAMGIDWMTGRELAQAIPPAYTEHIGRQLMEHVMERAA